MIKRIQNILIALVLTSCVETIVLETGQSMPVVVHCVLTNSTDCQIVYLSSAESPLGNRLDKRAFDVSVTSSSEETYSFEQYDECHWFAYFRPESGKKYTLRVKLDNGKELYSETAFPDSIAVNDYYADRDNPDHKMNNPYPWPSEAFSDDFYYADRLFDEHAHDYLPTSIQYNNQTRNHGFKFLDPKEYDSGRYIDVRRYYDDSFLTDSERKDGKKSIWEKHPYQRSCYLWVTARSPQRPEEFPLDALYVPGHEYRSVYLATDFNGVDNFNALQVTLGDLECFNLENAGRIESAIEERDKELIPSFYSHWSDIWYGTDVNDGEGSLRVKSYFRYLSEYSELPLHKGFLRLVYPDGGYRNQYSLADPDQRYDESGDAIWVKDDVEMQYCGFFPSPFTFHVFADYNLDDP